MWAFRTGPMQNCRLNIERPFLRPDLVTLVARTRQDFTHEVMGLLTPFARRPSASPSRYSSSPLFLRICSCVLLCLLVVVYALRSTCDRDPGSIFFKPATAYQPKYSLIRQEQAEHYINQSSTDAKIVPSDLSPEQEKHLCVGIPSVGREGTRYLRTTVGSLLEGLSPEERENIHLVVLIAHSDPFANPEYHEPWLANLVDHVLLYEPSQLDHITALEADVGNREKMLYDYAYTLRTCIDAKTPYIAMLEDDVLASDGWFWRTLLGLQQADDIVAHSSKIKDYLYMRLFYTEEFLGWNSEAWRVYLFWSIVFAVGTIGAALTARTFSATAKKTISALMLSLAVVIALAFAILLFFAAGKTTVLALPRGLNEMNQYGCCSQGLVFPRDKAQDIANFFEDRKIGYVDMLIEEYADEHAEFRWALTPPVLQHIGRKSSKGDDFGEASKNSMPVAAKLWNFQYELNDPEELRTEHAIVVDS